MKLDVTCMRYMSKDDFRVLTAVEMGMKNHDVVPVELLIKIAKLRHGGVQKFLSTLLRFKLVYHDKTTYDGTQFLNRFVPSPILLCSSMELAMNH